MGRAVICFCVGGVLMYLDPVAIRGATVLVGIHGDLENT